MRAFLHGFFFERGFRREFKKELKTLILFTLGFTIAFTWRQTIFDLSIEFMAWLTRVTNQGTLSIITSTFITIFSLGLIYLSSHFLKEEY